MPVLDVEQDVDAHSMTITAEFAAEPERVWRLYEDPRQLERHWGPPSWPATFVEHDLVPGGRSHYFMTGPDGERADGVWRVTAVDRPRSFELEDAFADEHGVPNEELGWTRMALRLDPVQGGTRVRIVSTFQSVEQLKQMLDMGMADGLREAMAQIDALLAQGVPS
jgi:uncharacterized protein YndB with AHSA1/START domain